MIRDIILFYIFVYAKDDVPKLACKWSPQKRINTCRAWRSPYKLYACLRAFSTLNSHSLCLSSSPLFLLAKRI